ncbi:unnamed protein product [Pseudo-nitzschia multistriata]|uniref:Peptidase S1 domain-containing protein n=1 Tax=Pseudo-nitzschia multistriata TaxID=183589 RepID=A0A448ZDG0_9STRA|nr:unnamed protein product [Pseudo-nitzschia multistriata]
MLLKRSILSALLIGAATTSSTFAAPDASSSRTIVNGEQSTPGDYPYFVNFGDVHRCGAALVAPDIILTAAHCGELTGKQVFVGAYEIGTYAEGAQERYCEHYISDPFYAKPFNYHENGGPNADFAICKLNEPVTIDQSFVTLELNEDDAFPADGTDLLVMGTGTLSSGGDIPQYLQNVTVQAIDNDDCEEYYDEGQLTEDTMCAGTERLDKDSCQGDSGGPLVKRTYRGDGTFVDTHVGVVSFGYGCGDEHPGVYARTSRRASWIKSTSCLVLNSVASFCDDIKEKPDPSSGTGHHLSIEISGNIDGVGVGTPMGNSSRSASTANRA